ncbi:MAG TPA: metal-dependent hydrolase [Gemmatimonadales bacterium]|jgi:L-ascorbate metabolism protein UlaG (beta-lactamase superfamily)|nr:metal-dependent hydrolase [Gemmatimonadales bacterium]
MSITLTFLGHAAVLLEDGKHTVAVDPFLTGNPVAARRAKDIRCTHIVLTHGHGDHLGDTIEVALANDATVYANFEITEYLGEHGVATEPGNPGGRIATDFGWVAFTQAWHSSGYQGRYLGVACGAMVHLGDVTVYHCGDTGIFGDMALLGEIYRPDVALIPIGDRYTMGPELGSRAAELIKPRIAIPIHYGTFPQLVPDATGFTPRGVEIRVLQPGETLHC